MEHVVGEQGKSGVALVPHAGVDDAAGEERAGLDPVLGRVEVLVDLGQAAVHVPQEDQADAGGGGEHAVLLVLVQPLVAVLHEQLVLPEAGVDEAVDEAAGEVLPRAVHGAAAERRPDVVEVRLVDVVRRLGLHDVELPGEVEEVVVEVAVGHDLGEIVVVLPLLGDLEEELVPAQHVAQLLLHDGVGAGVEELLHQLTVVELEGEPHGLRELGELAEDVERRLEQVGVLRVRHVGHAGHQVEADTVVGRLVDVLLQRVELLHLHEEVTRLGLGVVLHLTGHDQLGERDEPGLGGLALLAVVLLDHLPGQVAHVLVAPELDLLGGLVAAQLELQALPLLGHGHGQHRHHVGAQPPRLGARCHLLERRLHRVVVGDHELEGLGHAGHGGGGGADEVGHRVERGFVQLVVILG